MKLLTAFIAFTLSGLALAQTPPRSGSASGTINRNGSVNDPGPTGPTRPQWNPNPGPATPTTPRPQPRPDYRDDRRPDTRPDYRPQPDARDPNIIYVGDYVLYNGNEYEVLGGSNGTLEVRTPYAGQRYYIPANAVARTNGCAQTHYGPVCVGDMTVGLNNVYYAVIGLEWNGRVVVQTTDVTKTVYGQIDANSLKVVR